jgi:hypothetical protein
MPPKITSDDAKALAQALLRGEEHRRRISLTIGRQVIDERTFAASPLAVAERVKEKVSEVFGGDGDGDRR